MKTSQALTAFTDALVMTCIKNIYYCNCVTLCITNKPLLITFLGSTGPESLAARNLLVSMSCARNMKLITVTFTTQK